MAERRVIHVITPGDHFSPRTGSAIPTVVDGVARAAERAGDRRHAVVLDESTYRPRYDSADIIEYTGVPGPSRVERYTDALRGRLGLPRAGVARYFTPACAALRDEPPSIVLAHNAPIVPWLLRDSPHTTVLYAHNDLLRTYSKAETERMLVHAAAIVCVSESLAERTRERLPRSLIERVHVVGNGVDTEQFSPGPARTRSDPPRVMFVGRVIPDKGPDVLLRAAAALDENDAEIVIVGRPGFAPDAPLTDYERSLRSLAAECRCAVRFETFVARDDLPRLLRQADIFVVPSRWPEPWALTAGEALATGLPTIASRIGGIPEVIGDAGVLIAPDSPSGMTAALRNLLDDQTGSARIGASARARAEAHDWTRTWHDLDEVLDEL
jgi:glycosyltransferase involved in cell wall biosynthesis